MDRKTFVGTIIQKVAGPSGLMVRLSDGNEMFMSPYMQLSPGTKVKGFLMNREFNITEVVKG